MKEIKTSNAPAAIGPYSQAIDCGNMVFVSGQIPVNPKSGVIEGKTVEEQAHQVFKNIGEVLKAAGLDFSNVCKATVFVSDINNFGVINKIYEEYFISKPARSLVEVSAIPKGALLECEVIAVR